MDTIQFFYAFNGNRDLAEDKQGYAHVSLITAASRSMLTDHIVNESIKNGSNKREIKINFAEKSLEINKKHCPKVYNVTDPLTDEVYPELTIEELYNKGQFFELYEELSNVIADVSTLKEGIKKK